MNSLVGQRLWKWILVAGIISVIAGVVVLVWPFDSIAVLTLAAGIWLVIVGITQIIQAFQTPAAGYRMAAPTCGRGSGPGRPGIQNVKASAPVTC